MIMGVYLMYYTTIVGRNENQYNIWWIGNLVHAKYSSSEEEDTCYHLHILLPTVTSHILDTRSLFVAIISLISWISTDNICIVQTI